MGRSIGSGRTPPDGAVHSHTATVLPVREFEIRDPDGHHLVFGQGVSDG